MDKKAAERVIHCDVAISGLGPTGLTLAHLLGKRGLNVVVLEREPTFYGNARAVYTDDECMRIFQSVDLADQLAADMLQDAPVQMVLPNGDVLAQIMDLKRPYGWAASNFFYQPFLETKMADELARYPNVNVYRGREVVGFEQDKGSVNVFHSATTGSQYGKQAATASPSDPTEVESVKARYFVACDGGRSSVRTQLGIQMTGKSFPNPWLVVDIKQKDGLSALRHLPYFNFVCDPDCPTVSCLQPNGHHRFEFMLMPGQTKEHMEDPATIRRLLSKYVDVDCFEVLRSLVYTFNALIAETWRDRRVFLAGDAAHMTPQFIGQGMNAGVRDAYNLSWKLEAVIGGLASDTLLDTYQTERRPHVHAMIKTAVQMKDFVSMANPVKAFLRNALTRTVLATPKLGQFVREGSFIPQPEYEQGSYFGLPRQSRRSPEGRLLPQPSVRSSDGRRYRLDQFLGDSYALIGMGVNPLESLSTEQICSLEALSCRFVTMFRLGARPQGTAAKATPSGAIELEDIDGAYETWLRRSGCGSNTVAIVRPDRFVFSVAEPRRLPAAILALFQKLGVALPNLEASTA